MNSRHLIWLAAAMTIVAAGCAPQTRTISTRTLISEMTDLHALASFPEPPYVCRQFSSYDRKSTTPDDHESWFANADAGHYLRVEQNDGRTEYVMAEMDGPGAVVRIWSANPRGTLRVYLDGSLTPTLEAPMTEFLGGRLPKAPLPIAGERSRGWNSYLPIPYARQCRITSDQGGFYYHVNYRTYPPDTPVETATAESYAAARREIFATAADLAWPHLVGPAVADDAGRPFSLGPNETYTEEFRGQRAICQLQIDASRFSAEDLRRVILTIDFDGEETVSAPVGDFFGTVPGVNPYRSLPIDVSPEGILRSRWVMPFRKAARVHLRNLGSQTVAGRLAVRTEPHRWTERSMYFHARWRQSVDVPTRPMIDWNYLTANGQGVFVGVSFAIANPTKHWWGEGDEKIYVDGEGFPSHFGTGTEDYYGYAWCCPDEFTHAFHNQPRCDGPGNYGHTAVNRWHILDAIPFTREFRFDMELWHWDPAVKVTMSVVPCWYARPGGSDTFAAIQPEDLVLASVPPYVAPRVAGAIEGEEMRVIEKTALVEPQSISGCSNDLHMWWHEGVKVGDRLVLGFDVPQAGRYRVLARFVTAGDYGIAQLAISDQPLGEPIDFFNDGIKLTDEIELGTLQLTSGENRFSATITGANEKAVKKYLFGLDYLRIEPAAEAPAGDEASRSEPDAADEHPAGEDGGVERVSLLGRELRSLPATPQREELERNLTAARERLAASPDDPDAHVWVGRRLGYLWRMNEAIDVYSRAIERFPDYAPLYRHRGHRYISLRQFERAIADLERAAELAAGQEDEIEPDGQPNARGIPLTTLKFNIWYHLGLAHFLNRDLEAALAAFRTCREHIGPHDDNLVAVTDWLFICLQRLGRDAEARELLEPIRADMEIIENHAYHKRLLMYKGVVQPESLLRDEAGELDLATQGFGVGNWLIHTGQRKRGIETLEKVVEGSYWPAFGFIAAEVELASLRTNSHTHSAGSN